MFGVSPDIEYINTVLRSVLTPFLARVSVNIQRSISEVSRRYYLRHKMKVLCICLLTYAGGLLFVIRYWNSAQVYAKISLKTNLETLR